MKFCCKQARLLEGEPGARCVRQLCGGGLGGVRLWLRPKTLPGALLRTKHRAARRKDAMHQNQLGGLLPI